MVGLASIISFGALFLSVIFMQIGAGSMAPFDALAGVYGGFTLGQVGLMGSTHFIGFLLGCIITPRFIGRVGYPRAFALVASMGAISALLHPVVPDPYAWAGLRLITGFAIAGSYTVTESWLNAKLRPDNRGQVMSIYRVVDLAGAIASQNILIILDPQAYISYNIIAIVCCLSLFPLCFTKSKSPEVTHTPSIRILETISLSRMAVVATVVAGTSSSSFRMIGPVYGHEIGLTLTQIAWFLSVVFIGATAAQIPVGWLADHMDRRKLLVWISALTTGVCAVIAAGVLPNHIGAVYGAAFCFGFTSWPLFSVAAVYINDLAERDSVVEINASLIFLYACGAIISPLITSYFSAHFGPEGLFYFIGGMHVILVLFGCYRLGARPVTGIKRVAYGHVPRTSFLLSRLWNRPESKD